MGITITPAADGLDLAAFSQQILHQHGIHIHSAKVVFQNADMMPLRGQIRSISAQERRLARTQETGDEINLYHTFLLMRG